MSDKKPRITLTGAIVILSLSIIIASWNISSAIKEASRNNMYQESYKYELGVFNNNFEELIRTIEKNNSAN